MKRNSIFRFAFFFYQISRSDFICPEIHFIFPIDCCRFLFRLIRRDVNRVIILGATAFLFKSSVVTAIYNIHLRISDNFPSPPLSKMSGVRSIFVVALAWTFIRWRLGRSGWGNQSSTLGRLRGCCRFLFLFTSKPFENSNAQSNGLYCRWVGPPRFLDLFLN